MSATAFHHKLAPGAEEAGRRLIASWLAFGPKAVNMLDPDRFPEILTDVAECVLDCMSNRGARNYADVVKIAAGTAPAELLAELLECSQAPAPHPSECASTLAILSRFDQARTDGHLASRIAQAHANGDDPAELLAEAAAPKADQPTAPGKPFPLTRCGDLEGAAEAMDFVEGLLTDGAASVVYGGSNTGKSFWALDLGACVATGRPFREELEVEAGSVVYVCLEGTHGARNRIAALKLAGRLPDTAPLFLVFSPVNLLEAGHAGRLAATVAQAAAQSSQPCRLVILDTLARAMAGGDENSGRDMSQAVQSVDRVRAATGAHVMLIHHCGKNELLGARGHSSLRAAMDTEIEVFRPDGETVSTVKITKQRDMPLGEAMPFTLESVTLGTDRRRKPITSCTVRHEDSILAATRGKAGRKCEVAPARLLELLPQPSTSAWLKAAAAELGLSKSAFYRAKDSLAKENAARMSIDGKWESLKAL